MKNAFVMACLLFAGLGIDGSATGRRITVDRIESTADVAAKDTSLVSLVKAAELRTGKFVKTPLPDLTVTMILEDVPLDDLVETILVRAGLNPVRANGTIRLREPKERTVTIDVVAIGVHSVIEELAEQCGVRNVMIDPDAAGPKGTFLFRDVPCSTAFSVVLSTMGLDAEMAGGSVLAVRGRE